MCPASFVKIKLFGVFTTNKLLWNVFIDQTNEIFIRKFVKEECLSALF